MLYKLLIINYLHCFVGRLAAALDVSADPIRRLGFFSRPMRLGKSDFNE